MLTACAHSSGIFVAGSVDVRKLHHTSQGPGTIRYPGILTRTFLSTEEMQEDVARSEMTCVLSFLCLLFSPSITDRHLN